MAQPRVVTIGYPRIGPQREMKKALEDYWNKKIDQDALLKVSSAVFAQNVEEQKKAGIQVIGVGSHSLYDPMLDWISRFGLLPPRFRPFQKKLNTVDLRFLMARGEGEVAALDMTKWFDTNYHNLTPEIDEATKFDSPDWSDFMKQIEEASRVCGAERVGAEVMGPLTFALKSTLSKVTAEEVIAKLTPLYLRLFQELKAKGVAEVQLQEPALILEKARDYKQSLTQFFEKVGESGVYINLVTFYEDLGECFSWATNLPNVSAVSLDFTRGDNLELLRKNGFPSDRRLGAGVVDGRSIWKDTALASKLYKEIRDAFAGEISIQPSCSLFHCPYDVNAEANIAPEVRAKLSFARQKLSDLASVASQLPGQATGGLERLVGEAEVKAPEKSLLTRSLPFEDRRKLQLTCLNNLFLPTSTIGSFPQIPAMRKIRLRYRKKEVSDAEYFRAVDQYIAYCVGVQEGIGLDVLVHGEPERSDMVEYFAERMDGFLFTQNGWVQSYGSRYVRPPIVYADIARTNSKPMTVREFLVAQECTDKPVKGMLTGPTTILAWSFPRKDIPRTAQAYQIAYALRDEVADLETAGCAIVQVDEPALRETLPIKTARWQAYLDGAVNAFRLTTTICKPETHVVSHFCYSEFGDVMQAIKDFDADQITIENSRSDDVILKFLAANKYDHDVAPGVYDVHSPAVPPEEKLEKRLQMILKSGLAPERIWVVPDCGLKTRKWEEVIASLRNVVGAVKKVRTSFA